MSKFWSAPLIMKSTVGEVCGVDGMVSTALLKTRLVMLLM